jgi:hypothetical protein
MVTASRNDALGRENRAGRGEGAASLTLKAAQWSGAGGVALHPNKPIFAPDMKCALGTSYHY